MPLLVYLFLALAVVAGGVTVVETYNHALTARSEALAREKNAEATARAEHQAHQDLQELVDYGDQVAQDRGKENDALRAKLVEADRKHAAAAKGDPCVGAAVPAATRQLRRDAFVGAPAPDLVLHPAPGTPVDVGTPAPGRDVGRPPEGGGPGPGSAPGVQRGQGDGAPDPRASKPATQSLRARLEALMRR